MQLLFNLSVYILFYFSMTRSSLQSVIIIGLLQLISSKFSFSQVPNFGSAANFAMFTSSGAVGNTGTSVVSGDIGSNSGVISNFTPGSVKGNTYSTDNVTAQASADLQTAYTQLYNFTTTNTSHSSSFGYNETLTAGVYAIDGAASVTGSLTLDANGDNTSIFIFKVNGAFTTGAGSTVTLINGASACNVFWVVEGAIALAASTNMVGTLLAHGAANSMGAGCSLQGRLYSTSGAISVNNVSATIPTGCVVPAPNCNNNPVIITQPVSAKLCNGQPYTFSVTATGANLSYQWRKDGADIVGATSSSYTIAATSPAYEGLYYVIIVGSCSPFAASQVDTLSVATQGINMAGMVNCLSFTCSGAISNTGSSNITGNIGTNAGAVTGFETSTVNGTIHNSDSVTARCVKDLQNLYNQLNTTSATNTTHAAVFGNGETITPGVYSIAGAGSVAGNLILDAGGDASKVFIFKIGGAFTTGAASTVSLINNASSCNIFWVAEGAISMAAGTTMKGILIAHNAAVSMATGGQLEGRLFSTLGAISFSNMNGVIPTGCLLGTKWTGTVGTDWFSTCNWYYGLLPNDTTNITIPAGLINYPIINGGIAHMANVTIQPNASLTVTNANLIIKGTIINNGNFNAAAGTITMAGATVQTITTNMFTNKTIQNIVIGNDVTLTDSLNITGAVTFSATGKTFNTANFLTLKSNALGTASIFDLTNGGTINGNTVSGNVTVELFIPQKRAWRLLSGQQCAANSQTINNAWQEGSNAANPAPGFGTQITGGSLAGGFDQGINKNPGIKIYNNSDNSLIGLPAGTGTNTPITNYPGYFVFIRGDRSTNLLLGVNAPVTSTTLRVKGPINMGNFNQPINAVNYTLVGNPYLESVDFGTLTRTNVANMFYVWDPKMGGASGVGAYVAFIWDGSKYIGTASVSQESQYIPYGEAFFVESEDGINSGTLTFKETDKTVAGSDDAFRPYLKNATIKIDLMEVNKTLTGGLIDGILTTYSINNNNEVDKNDARKMYNISENICLARNGINLAIESRKPIAVTDTSFIRIYNLKKKAYKLVIKTSGLDSVGLKAVIKDRYLATNNDMPLNKNGITEVFFSATTDTGSYSAYRFSIVFKRAAQFPLRFINFNASQHEQNILLKWKTENEINIKSYDVEESVNGIQFNKAVSINVKDNIYKTGNYGWLDTGKKEGAYFYRIKSINETADTTYSKLINITLAPNDALKVKSIHVAGNAIQSNNIRLQLNNIDKGVYKIELYNMAGQLVKKLSIDFQGGSAVENILIGNNLARGKYRIGLSNNFASYFTDLIN